MTVCELRYRLSNLNPDRQVRLEYDSGMRDIVDVLTRDEAIICDIIPAVEEDKLKEDFVLLLYTPCTKGR